MTDELIVDDSQEEPTLNQLGEELTFPAHPRILIFERADIARKLGPHLSATILTRAHGDEDELGKYDHGKDAICWTFSEDEIAWEYAIDIRELTPQSGYTGFFRQETLMGIVSAPPERDNPLGHAAFKHLSIHDPGFPVPPSRQCQLCSRERVTRGPLQINTRVYLFEPLCPVHFVPPQEIKPLVEDDKRLEKYDDELLKYGRSTANSTEKNNGTVHCS
jgi:hypothetical protein